MSTSKWADAVAKWVAKWLPRRVVVHVEARIDLEERYRLAELYGGKDPSRIITGRTFRLR